MTNSTREQSTSHSRQSPERGPTDDAMSSTDTTNVASHDLHTQYHIGFSGKFGLVGHKPVHETIAIAALIQSDLHWSTSTRYENLTNEQWEFIRGLVWPDDPSSLLFLESSKDNHFFDDGAAWYKEYKTGYPWSMTQRSHFGNLQFLHAMATGDGQAAQTTQDSLMAWLQVMYKLACGNQGVKASDTLGNTFPGQFTPKTYPDNYATLERLIFGRTTGYKAPQIPLRALGICLHIIADSFAIGHTQRQLLNPGDLAPRDSEGYISFKSGTTAQLGKIVRFHNYKGQDDDRHGHYDKLIGSMPDPNNIASFDSILGAKDAIAQSTKLLNFCAAKAPWSEVQQFLLNEVFALVDQPQPSDTNVDSGIYIGNAFYPAVVKPQTSTGDDIRRWKSQRMMADRDIFLEEGLVGDKWPRSSTMKSGGWRLFVYLVMTAVLLAVLLHSVRTML